MAEEVFKSVIEEVANSLIRSAKRRIKYIKDYGENVDKMINELKTSRCILDGVEEWVKKSDVEISNTEEWLQQENKVKMSCVNLGRVYRYSKIAVNKTPFCLQKQEDVSVYENHVSTPSPTPRFVDLYERKDLDHINTQKSTVQKIIRAIKDEHIQMVGIYRSGPHRCDPQVSYNIGCEINGGGKTTLAEEVATSVSNFFVDVVFITVSNMWALKRYKEVVQLPEPGIPCVIDNINWKIMFTSRRINGFLKWLAPRVCRLTIVRWVDFLFKYSFQSRVKLVKEFIFIFSHITWFLLKQVVGKDLETDLKLKEVAMDVSEKCGGLPLLIQVVGNALKDKNIELWDAALDSLKNHVTRDINPEMKPIIESPKAEL
ncbi:hypothetical protein OSB04_001166 [Centaurea solstitialis]|uniref:NB-ARC domain-containing protein n=1 Tax=Centaurea solstitialis TaxID=347529 RepID=A0AA38TQH4_9ASTR|nr:hypothetical protein OSB04_001166 [Centaurea solstitialis]